MIDDSRTVTPDGKKIARLRVDRGWSRSELAKRAKCSLATIANVETGEPLYPFTLGKIATALSGEISVQTSDLILKAPRSAGMTIIIFKTSIPAEEFDETRQLVQMVADLKREAGIMGQVAVLDVSYGSVLIKLEMDDEDAERMVKAFKDGKLKELLVEDVETQRATLPFAKGTINVTSGGMLAASNSTFDLSKLDELNPKPPEGKEEKPKG